MGQLKPPSKPRRNSHPRKTTTPDSEISARSLASNGPKLKQIQYRSYQHTVTIYHFNTRFMTVHQFRNLLRRNEHGYIDTLIGVDTLLAYQFIPDGDEVPAGRVEVAYLPFVFRNISGKYGSALGFRSQKGVIEWMCFDTCINSLILDAWVCEYDEQEGIYEVRVLENIDGNDARRVFDPVAFLDKGILKRAIMGAHEEHRRWHGSLLGAECRNVRLELTWEGYEEEKGNKFKAMETNEEGKVFERQENEETETWNNQDGLEETWDGASGE